MTAFTVLERLREGRMTPDRAVFWLLALGYPFDVAVAVVGFASRP